MLKQSLSPPAMKPCGVLVQAHLLFLCGGQLMWSNIVQLFANLGQINCYRWFNPSHWLFEELIVFHSMNIVNTIQHLYNRHVKAYLPQ